ncbi:MAG: sugar ABC transporter permease [Chlorobia bacterium]|nr:sugar ABC transporter permease [Fimbriimonadaceae bacterium]
MERKESRWGWLFIAPAFAHLLLFALAPILYAFGLSLFRTRLISPEREFAGVENYTFAVAEPSFQNALWNSARYALVSVPLGLIVALAVAILVNQKLKGITLFRTIYYIPAISSGVAIAMLWQYVYLPETGMINSLLGMLGLDNKKAFLDDVGSAMWAVAIMSVFTGLGPRMVLFLAGLVGIPQELYEAGALDGATGWRAFLKITLPMLIPTTFFVVVTSTISALQIFTPIYMMTKGGPEESTDVVGYHIYTEAWVNFNTGLASAKSFVLLVAIVAVSLVQFRMMKSQLKGYSAA